MKRFLLTGVMAAVIGLSMNITAFAGDWRLDVHGWWYDEGNGNYPVNSWKWIEAERGILKCYYFDDKGYCLINTTAPDAKQVNSNGEWTVDGIVQIKMDEYSHAGEYVHRGREGDWRFLEEILPSEKRKNIIIDYEEGKYFTYENNKKEELQFVDKELYMNTLYKNRVTGYEHYFDGDCLALANDEAVNAYMKKASLNYSEEQLAMMKKHYKLENGTQLFELYVSKKGDVLEAYIGYWEKGALASMDDTFALIQAQNPSCMTQGARTKQPVEITIMPDKDVKRVWARWKYMDAGEILFEGYFNKI